MNNETQLSDCIDAVAEAVAKGDAEIEAARLVLKEHESKVRARISALVEDVAKVKKVNGS